jgi:hypothetical protein
MLYVNIYAVGQGYGGPEEGGWWFPIGTPVGAIPVQLTDEEFVATRDAFTGDPIADHEDWRRHLEQAERAKAEPVRELYELLYPATGRQYSVLGGEDYAIRIEDGFPQPYPTTAPVYE